MHRRCSSLVVCGSVPAASVHCCSSRGSCCRRSDVKVSPAAALACKATMPASKPVPLVEGCLDTRKMPQQRPRAAQVLPIATRIYLQALQSGCPGHGAGHDHGDSAGAAGAGAGASGAVVGPRDRVIRAIRGARRTAGLLLAVSYRLCNRWSARTTRLFLLLLF